MSIGRILLKDVSILNR